MLKIYNLKDLSKPEIEVICQRNLDKDNSVGEVVERIINRVKIEGDAALRCLTSEFDGVDLDKLYLDRSELEQIASGIGSRQKEALNIAYENIRKFHLSQVNPESRVETTAGVTCWREARPIEKVGLYIPGGTAVLPSTFLMLGIPAKIAGCREIVVCSPAQKDALVNPYLAYCAILIGVEKIYLVGGAQAVAAMAYGTESIPRVDKIFGPGNQFVTKAKTIIQSNTQTAIDMPAGPSEVLVIADESANPVYVAADLLAQAEHGPDSQAILVCSSAEFIGKTIEELEKQLTDLPRQTIARKALQNSYAVLVNDLREAISFSNQYAPEHLILATGKWQSITDSILNAGSVFLGNYTPESAGDYASGTNHTLPTSSYAKAYSGVSVDSFVKKITFQYISEQGIQNLGPTVEILAELEGLQAHRNAVSVRLKNQ